MLSEGIGTVIAGLILIAYILKSKKELKRFILRGNE